MPLFTHVLATLPFLTLILLRPEYIGRTRSMTWLLMPWLLASPGYQQQCHWLCRTPRFLSPMKTGVQREEPHRAVLIKRRRLISIGIPSINIRRSRDRLIFIMRITIPGKTVFILRRGPTSPWYWDIQNVKGYGKLWNRTNRIPRVSADISGTIQCILDISRSLFPQCEIWVSFMSSKSGRSFTFQFIVLSAISCSIYRDMSRAYSIKLCSPLLDKTVRHNPGGIDLQVPQVCLRHHGYLLPSHKSATGVYLRSLFGCWWSGTIAIIETLYWWYTLMARWCSNYWNFGTRINFSNWSSRHVTQ